MARLPLPTAKVGYTGRCKPETLEAIKELAHKHKMNFSNYLEMVFERQISNNRRIENKSKNKFG